MSDYRSLNGLMRHMRDNAGVRIGGSTEKMMLAHVGYFHGFKGYRYSGQPTRRLPLTDFRELKAVIDFDTQLKTLFYPVLMTVEMKMKNLALVDILQAADSSALDDLYKLMPGGPRKDQKRDRLKVIHSCNGALLNSYNRENRIVCHYYDSPVRAVPIWALVEIIALGQFGELLRELPDSTRGAIAGRWGIGSNHGGLAPSIVWTVKDLRNAVAHNNPVFDTRFKTGSVRRDLGVVLASALGCTRTIDFGSITDYFMLVSYLSACLGAPKRELYRLVAQYRAVVEALRRGVPSSVFDMIVHSDNRPKIDCLEAWVRSR